MISNVIDHLLSPLINPVFKMDERNVDEPVIGGAPNLDDMLGNLQVYNQSHNKIIRIKKKIMEEHGRT